MLLIVGYVLLASYSMEEAIMTTSENVQGTNSALRTTENNIMASLNKNVRRGKGGGEMICTHGDFKHYYIYTHSPLVAGLQSTFVGLPIYAVS